MNITINIDKDLVERIDDIANKLYLSRSAYISMTMSRAVNSEKMNEQLPLMVTNFNEFMSKFYEMTEEEEKQQTAEKRLKGDVE